MATGIRSLLSRPCLAGLASLALAASCLATEPGQQPAVPAPPMGQLDIVGEGVESVTLARRTGPGDSYGLGNLLVLRISGSSASVAAGEYRLLQIDLTGGFRCCSPLHWVNGEMSDKPEWLTISPDKPCILKAGTPLKLAPSVYRLGRLVHLTNELLDAEGRMYRATARRGQLPRFTIYQGDCQRASSDSMSLEYG